MTTLSEIVAHLNAVLTPERFPDGSYNGVQVEADAGEIKTIAVAVDAGESVIAEAVRRRAELLIVHHGIFWGHQEPVNGIFGRKVRALIKGGCTLYASHLPLDAHLEVGNNAELARFFGLTIDSPFGRFDGVDIGVRGHFGSPRSREEILRLAETIPGTRHPLFLPFGPEQIQTVGIVSGSGSSAIYETAQHKLDLLITGEPKQSAYHDAKERGCNVLFAGHYATETFGVKALAALLKARYGVATTFIDEPTGI